MDQIKRFAGRVHRSEFAKNTATLTAGTAVAQGVGIAAMPVLSRLYTPADFGLLAVFVAVSSIVATVITLRYETAILLPKDEEEAKALLILSAVLALFLGCVLGFGASLLPTPIKIALGVSVLNEWLPFAAICGTAAALLAVGTNWLNRQRSYVKMASLRVTQGSTAALISISLGFFGLHTGLMLAQLIASFLVVAILIYGLRILRPIYSSHKLGIVAARYIAAPKYLLPTALLDVATLHLPVLLITAWFSSEAAGQFSMAWKVLALPSALIGGAVGQVFFQRFSELWPNAQAARNLLFQTWKMLALFGALPTLVMIFFGEQLFRFVLGVPWSDAGNIASVLAPMLFAMLISSPTSGAYLVLGLQRYSLMFGVAVCIYRPLCLLAGFVNDNLIFGLVALMTIEIAQILIYQLIVIRKIKLSL